MSEDVVFTNVIEHRLSRRHRHGIARERVEVRVVVGKCVEHVGANRHGGTRDAVSHGFAHRHDIGHDAMAREAPERIARAAESGLHLVGNIEAALAMYQVND